MTANANTNKSWGDKADKDLFFTILSVKNIGVISGSEWTTIGNHMRSMGYGFTNEGCRQHFQGLRRSQQKLEAASSPIDDSTSKIDPTENPITRRPGPGRGRPRKSAAAAAAAAAAASSAVSAPAAAPAAADAAAAPAAAAAAPAAAAAAAPPDAPGAATATEGTTTGTPQQPASGTDLSQGDESHQPLAQHVGQQPLPSLTPQPNVETGVGPAPTPMMDQIPSQMLASPPEQAVDMQTEDVFSENVSEEPEEHAAKRAKLEENHDPALNDEAMLSALAAHNNPDSLAHYSPDFYGEA